MKNQLVKIAVPIYEVEIICIVSTDSDWAINEVKPFVDEEDHKAVCEFFSGRRSDGFNLSNRHSGCQIIYLKESPRKNSYTLSVFAHEVFHAVVGILRNKDMELNYNCEEAYAYLLGYLFKEIYDELK